MVVHGDDGMGCPFLGVLRRRMRMRIITRMVKWGLNRKNLRERKREREKKEGVFWLCVNELFA